VPRVDRNAGARYRRAVRTLVICRPVHDDARGEIARRAAEEFAALRALREDGVLLEAYSPGGPGAILILDGDRTAAERALRELPLVRDAIVGTEVIELHPFAALTP
jgi:hypothetical protein